MDLRLRFGRIPIWARFIPITTFFIPAVIRKEGSSQIMDVVAGLLILLVLLALCFLPSIVAIARHHHNVGLIIILNVFLGVTGIGWVVAMAIACGQVKEPRNRNRNRDRIERHPGYPREF